MHKSKDILLVVDDVPAICSLLADYFESRGYRVLTAGNAQEACRLLAQHEFSLLITDLQLQPEQPEGGLEVIQCARRAWPDAPVIVISGSASPATLIRLEKFKVGALLAKPVHLERLHSLVKRLLPEE